MKTISKIVVAFLVVTLFAFIPAKKNKTITVVVDVSHGGKDAGNTHGIISEKEIVQQIAAKMALLNNNTNVKLHFTRDTDKTISLQDRVKFINQLKPDAVLSLHLNGKNSKNASGLRVFYAEGAMHDTKTQELADKIFENFKASKLFTSRTISSAPFYILKKSKAPSLLLELGNMDNQNDMKIVQNDTQQEAIAHAILDALNSL